MKPDAAWKMALTAEQQQQQQHQQPQEAKIELRRKELGFHKPHPSRFGFQLFGFRVQGSMKPDTACEMALTAYESAIAHYEADHL